MQVLLYIVLVYIIVVILINEIQDIHMMSALEISLLLSDNSDNEGKTIKLLLTILLH